MVHSGARRAHDGLIESSYPESDIHRPIIGMLIRLIGIFSQLFGFCSILQEDAHLGVEDSKGSLKGGRADPSSLGSIRIDSIPLFFFVRPSAS